MGKKFSVSDLDEILNEAVDKNELTNIQNELMNEQNEELVPTDDVSPEIANMVDKKTGLTVDYSRVYKQLEKLIENGNIALQVIAAIDPDTSDGQIGTSTASLMNAIKNCIAQFTKIHLQHIKFQQTLQMMQIKHRYKMEQIAKRNQAFKNRDDAIDITNVSNTKNGNVLVPFNTENVIDYIQYVKQQKQEKRV